MSKPEQSSTVARLRTYAIQGVAAVPVTVEAAVTPGLPSFRIVGIGDRAARELRERVRAALAHAGEQLPAGRITVNVAGAVRSREGIDAAIALAVLAAVDRHLAGALERVAVVGPLAVDGELRPVRGALAIARAAAADAHVDALALPQLSMPDALLLTEPPALLAARSLRELIATVTDRAAGGARPRRPLARERLSVELDDVGVPAEVVRGLEVAAAGRHAVLLEPAPSAPPGSYARVAGLVADASALLAALLPPLGERAALEVATIRSVADLPHSLGAIAPPYRAPSHTAEAAHLLGEGSMIGEITLAHHGILKLRDVGRFSRTALTATLDAAYAGVVTRGAGVELPASALILGTTLSTQDAASVGDRFELRVQLDPAGPDVPVAIARSQQRVAAARTLLTAGAMTLTPAAAHRVAAHVGRFPEPHDTRSGGSLAALSWTIAALDGRTLATVEDVDDAVALLITPFVEAQAS